MNKLLKILAYGLGGVGLLIASFLVFASLGGVPLSTLPLVGGIFPMPPEKEAAPPEPATVEAQIDEDRRPAEQVLDTTTSPLYTFTISDPWSATQLESLEQSLEAQMAKLMERERDLIERERDMDERARQYDRLFTELEELRSNLLDQSDEASALRAEEERAAQAAEMQRLEGLKRIVSLYADGDAKQIGRQLLDAHDSREAGEILSMLDPERAAELVSAIHKTADPQEYRAITEAYSRAGVKSN